MKYLSLVVFFLLFSCGNKEDILLPKSNVTVISSILDHSPIYIFFRINGNDTLAEVNRKNSIITTNWILNIDKRLPLKLVIPEVMKLQDKKRQEKAHKNEKAENYYSYADSIGKNMAFILFTQVYYTVGKPTENSLIIHFKQGDDLVLVDAKLVKKESVVDYVKGLNFTIKPKILLLFDKNMSFGEYLQNKIVIRDLDSFTDEVAQEFIY